MIVPIMLTLASSASDGQPESDFHSPEAWTDDLVASINHILDTSGPFPEDWLPGEPPLAEGSDDE